MEKLKPTFSEYNANELWEQELVAREKTIYREKVLGIDIDVKPLPAVVTPQVVKSLEQWGFKLRYIPQLQLGDVTDLRNKEIIDFVQDIVCRYPLWSMAGWWPRPSKGELNFFESEKSKNLGYDFWDHVRNGNISFPQVESQWVAIETKQREGKHYSFAPLSDRLKLPRPQKAGDDFKFHRIHKVVQDVQDSFLSEIGLHGSALIRLPEAVELNLVNNAERWRYKREWTNTKIWNILHRRFTHYCLDDYTWNFDGGYDGRYINSQDLYGFRLAIVFK